ncbi:MAG: Toxin HigB-2 [Planctomycetes bacterium ADurb.Bin126]|nr:MAG: Toxin HigB-2 [Planctomycetes bacterium ADurb.Bin126]HOD82332.1 type II toxin-antitoxin system RelE/ParE family toxin [Phycisphaerae bacterium]HQL71918.1 type II toxin-antitoxin system RelE/ParE family toxin [Phycisphaerae bacterium]
MIRVFVESPAFTSAVHAEGIADKAIRDLQADILAGRGDTVAGTGGLQKIRWARSGSGKRGGRRVLYADYPAYGITILLSFYAKNVKENLSPAETAQWKLVKEAMDARMERTYGKQR